jgi:quinol-cytochrome oxidoreductase complex cytochrome b subunit
MSDFESPSNNRAIGWAFVFLLVFFLVAMVVLTVLATQQALSREAASTQDALGACDSVTVVDYVSTEAPLAFAPNDPLAPAPLELLPPAVDTATGEGSCAVK